MPQPNSSSSSANDVASSYPRGMCDWSFLCITTGPLGHTQITVVAMKYKEALSKATELMSEFSDGNELQFDLHDVTERWPSGT